MWRGHISARRLSTVRRLLVLSCMEAVDLSSGSGTTRTPWAKFPAWSSIGSLTLFEESLHGDYTLIARTTYVRQLPGHNTR